MQSILHEWHSDLEVYAQTFYEQVPFTPPKVDIYTRKKLMDLYLLEQVPLI